MARTILFIFAGRQPNLQIAIPYYRRILDQHPDVELHLWDLCRDPQDSRYLRGITGDRIHIRRDYSNQPPAKGQAAVWKHYAQPEYQGCLFVKADDDDLFWETDRFGDFVQAAADNPDHVISALTINNGASTPHIPGIHQGFEQLGIPLLDVHLHADYAAMCHRWFHTNWRTLTGQTAELIPTEDWLSINALAITWDTLRAIAELIGTPSPRRIAGRTFPRRNARGRLIGHRIGDEGAANMLPRLIHRGMVVAHFTFGPQDDQMTAELQAELRDGYAAIAAAYLAAVNAA